MNENIIISKFSYVFTELSLAIMYIAFGRLIMSDGHILIGWLFCFASILPAMQLWIWLILNKQIN